MPALSRLVSVSLATADGAAARQVVRLTDLGAEASVVMRIFAAREARLVVLGRNEITGEETVQVAHEALIRTWTKLKSWIETNREFLVWRQQLRSFLDKWRSLTEGKETALLVGIYLAEASRWLRERPQDLSEDERQFIIASEKPVVRSRRMRQGAVAAILVLFSVLLVSADAGLSFPSSGQLRRFIDQLNISVMRRPKTASQLKNATKVLISDTVDLIATRRAPDGWIENETKMKRTTVDYWSHAESVCALLHVPSNKHKDTEELSRELAALFTSLPKDWWKGNYGVPADNNTAYPRVESLLWTGNALAALASKGIESDEPWSKSRFGSSVRYVQESSLRYHDKSSNGWWVYPQTNDGDTYATTLATQMLMDLRDAHVSWPGGEDPDVLIRHNIEWLVKQYHRDRKGTWGWKEGTSDDTVPGLTLQTYAVLLRAQAEGDRPVPPAIISTITKILEDGFQDTNLINAMDMTVLPKDIMFTNPADGRQSHPTALATQFVWYPWAIECIARWLDLQPEHTNALHNHLVRRTLTDLLMGENRRYLQNGYYTFRYNELLYALGSLEESLSRAER